MASFPQDRFDQLPDDLVRVGAHRGPKRRGGGWAGFAWAVLATGVLVAGGLFGINRVLGIDLGLPFLAAQETPTPTPTPTPTMDPILDPTTIDPARAIRITVLNGTTTPGLQSTVGQELAAAGWPIGGTLNASSTDIEDTFIYYSDPLNEDVARGLAISPAGVTVVPKGHAFSAECHPVGRGHLAAVS
jgi:hypothetical protein